MVRLTACTQVLSIAVALMLVGLTPGRADVLEVRINGNTVACPTMPTAVPPPLILPLPIGTVAMFTDFFDCDVFFPGAGAFEVFGAITVANGGSGATGFSSFLGFTATVVAQGAVNPAGTSVFVDVKQLYTAPSVPVSVSSKMGVDGSCNTPLAALAGFEALNFAFYGPFIPVINPTTGGHLFPCGPTGMITAGLTGGPATPWLGVLEAVGSVYFPPGTTGGDALALEMQQVATNPLASGPTISFLPAPPTPLTKLSTADGMNEFVPLPDPSDGFVMVFAGDVLGSIDIDTMRTDPTINAFAYKGGQFSSHVSTGFDANGNSVITFSGDVPISSSDIFCYNGPLTCNNVPHFGVAAAFPTCVGNQCSTLKMLKQFWTNNPGNPLPGLTVASPPLTGSTLDYTILFADVTTGSKTVGQWFQVPSATKAAPLLTVCNNTAAGVTTSNGGFQLTPFAILQDMNFGKEPPPGQPGSKFIGLSVLNGLFLASGACVTFNPEPDIAVATGVPMKQGTKLIVGVNLNNTGATSANNVTISSIKPTLPSTYVGPVLPLTVGNIGAGTSVSQNIQIDVTGLASGSIARFQINGAFQDSAGNNFLYSSVRGVKVP
jgi:hypothetical protein